MGRHSRGSCLIHLHLTLNGSTILSERFLQTANIVAAFVPVEMQTAANNGDWVSLTGYDCCVAILFKAAGTAGNDPIFTLKQASDASGTGSKSLNFTTVYSKVGTQTGLANFTRTIQAAATSYTDTVSAEAQAIIAIEIDAASLDVDGGFTHIQLSIPDTGTNAQLGAACYLMLDPRH